MTLPRLAGIAILAAFILGIALTGTASATAHITYSGNGQFTISSGPVEEVTVGGISLTCEGSLGSGKLGANPAITAELTISLAGCESAGFPCTSSGGKSGLIDFVKLVATLGDINKTTAGALLKPASGTSLIASTKCGSIALELKGSVIGEFKSTQNDKNTKALTLTFAQSKGIQAIKKFEGEANENTIEANLGKGFEKAGIEFTETLTLATGSGQLLP